MASTAVPQRAVPQLPPFDPYLTLGVPKDADVATIRSAFEKAQQSYEILSDSTRRAQYDHDVVLVDVLESGGPKDPYVILNVPRGADPETICLAHQQLMQQFRPQALAEGDPPRPNWTDESQEIQQAYELLSDMGKRADYDELVEAAMRMPNGNREYLMNLGRRRYG